MYTEFLILGKNDLFPIEKISFLKFAWSQISFPWHIVYMNGQGTEPLGPPPLHHEDRLRQAEHSFMQPEQ